MKITDYLGVDGHVILALCSHFGLPTGGSTKDWEPFKPSEWHHLATRIEHSVLKSPSALNGLTVIDLKKSLSINLDDAERIARLLARSSKLALEIENLFSHGMWVVTSADALYPAKLRAKLKQQTPPVIFGAGMTDLVHRQSVAIIGSRNIDEPGAAFAREIGSKAAHCRIAVVSGGARGTDRLAMTGAIEAGGIAIGALADSLESTIRKPDVRELLSDERLVLFTANPPNEGFSVGAAMSRNRFIYVLSEAAFVVSSDYQTGGTWAGAVEALKFGWCPVFVRHSPTAPKGNQALEKLGAVALPEGELEKISDLSDWIRANTKTQAVDQGLFKFGSTISPA